MPLRHAVAVLRQASQLERVIWEGGPPLDRALQAHQRARPSMGRNDRLLLGAATYGLARNREALRCALPDAAPGEGRLLLLGLIDSLSSRVGDIPNLPGGVAPWLTVLDRLASLRTAWVRDLEGGWESEIRGARPRVLQAFADLFSVPPWWLRAGPWERVGEAALELALLRRPQHLTLRVQTHRLSRDAALAELRDLGIPARPTERSPWGLVLEGRHNVLSTAIFREGRVEVQDEGSQLVACLCDPKPSEKVLDLCAGGGGKSLALASQLMGRGQIVAHDTDARRLSDTRRRARRASLGNIRIVPDVAAVESLGPYDLVLVDAPCTSSGTLRRNPDAAWRWTEEALGRLVREQAGLLEAAANLVAPGGVLVYVTCSLLTDENGGQVERFLAGNPDFQLSPPGDRRGHGCLAGIPGAQNGSFRIPANLAHYSGDAFFLARLRRRG